MGKHHSNWNIDFFNENSIIVSDVILTDIYHHVIWYGLPFQHVCKSAISLKFMTISLPVYRLTGIWMSLQRYTNVISTLCVTGNGTLPVDCARKLVVTGDNSRRIQTTGREINAELTRCDSVERHVVHFLVLERLFPNDCQTAACWRKIF